MLALEQKDRRTVAVATMDGILSSKQLRYGYSTLVEFCRANDSFKILLDFTQVTATLSTLDIYNMPRDALAAGLSPSAKLAILCAPGQVEVFGFLAVVSQNVGLNTYEFYNSRKQLKPARRAGT